MIAITLDAYSTIFYLVLPLGHYDILYKDSSSWCLNFIKLNLTFLLKQIFYFMI